MDEDELGEARAQRQEEDEEEAATDNRREERDENEDNKEQTTRGFKGSDEADNKIKRKDRCVPGIVYLGHIPPRLRPKHLRNMLSVYGEIGRVFLQPEDHQVRSRKKRAGLRRCDFTEGWVEFRDKRVAKKVALSLHNTPMGTRKRQRFFSDLWNIKYLHRFQWTHLSERLAYEQTVLQQRLRAEVSQAKKETNFYLNNVEKSAHLDKQRKKKQKDNEQIKDKIWDFTQRQTEEEIQKKKKKRDIQKHLDKTSHLEQKSQSNISLLTKIFNSSQSQ